eukprot:TRINITY_DN3332_c0_g1_i2.p1 TRINITY_DN3332_c0_g1~~TRINITY_DN3332_c0_g1_i2.p1  ORF type:complete len:363 (-),score=69.57 TRINITY_DN3332_c0_g1_i2:347-1435(-)
MGLCTSKTFPEQAIIEQENNKDIDAEIEKSKNNEKQFIKVLLLGTGESGKSTLAKQMKILHLNGFTMKERLDYIGLILLNTLESIQKVCQACMDMDITFTTAKNRERAMRILSFNLPLMSGLDIPLDLKEDIKSLWRDAHVQAAFSRANIFHTHFPDSAAYFLDCVDRTFESNYVPNDQDILRSRVATTGIIQTVFALDGLHFKMIDVGGQRGERKKWIHCFENVTAILFLASLSEYDQVLMEYNHRNRMVESLDLFESIVNKPWFRQTAIILFLTKQDIFKKKIMQVELSLYFPYYSGPPHDYSSALAFIQECYFERNNNPSKVIYCHVTDATDTTQIAFVWKAARHIILQQNLNRSGLLT